MPAAGYERVKGGALNTVCCPHVCVLRDPVREALQSEKDLHDAATQAQPGGHDKPAWFQCFKRAPLHFADMKVTRERVGRAAIPNCEAFGRASPWKKTRCVPACLVQAFFSGPVCVVQMATQDRAGPSAPRRSTTGEHRRGHVDLPPTIPLKTGLQAQVDPTLRCCRGLYSLLILTPLAPTAEPVEKRGVIPFKLSRFRNKIEREAASDEQLVAVSPKALARTATASGSSGSILACLLTTHLRAG
ncbi:hypothetical protein MRX96_020005 [Rhipicephalus microplus]